MDMEKSKILPPRYFTISILLIPLFHYLIPIAALIFFPWNLTGLLLIALGGLLNLFADKDFKKRNTTVKPFEESTVLITDGVFRISRNPMYLGMLFLLLGESLLFGSISSLIVVIAFTIVIHFVFIVEEEKMLTNKFGSEYIKYAGRVRRWI